MKKLLLIGTIAVAGLMSAKITKANHLKVSARNLKKTRYIQKKNIDDWCGTVYYHLPCGTFGDSFCLSWGEECLTQAAKVLEDYYCHP